MIVFIGINTDKTIKHTLVQSLRLGVEFTYIDLFDFMDRGAAFFGSSGEFRICVDDININLADDSVSGIYTRLICPKFVNLNKDEGNYARQKFAILNRGLLLLQHDRIVNPPLHDFSNSNRAIHLKILAECGFTFPETLISSNPSDVQEFLTLNKDRGVIYKSNSGIKTITRRVSIDELERINLVEHCPVVFQEQIFGDDVRIHMLNGVAYGLRIQSPDVDYRFSKRTTKQVLSYIPDDIRHAMVSYSARSHLKFIGFDFKVEHSSGRWICLEANPMPGYESYDRFHNGAISTHLIKILENEGNDEG